MILVVPAFEQLTYNAPSMVRHKTIECKMIRILYLLIHHVGYHLLPLT